MRTVTITRIRGERIRYAMRIQEAGVNFASVVWSADVRAKPDGEVLASATVAAVATVAGRADVTVTIPGTVARDLPGWCALDLVAEDEGAEYGPTVHLRLYIQILGAYSVSSASAYRFDGVEILSGASYRRIVGDADGGVSVTDATGENQYASVDLKRPDGTYRSLNIGADGGLYADTAKGVNQMPHIEVTFTGGYARIWIDDTDQVLVSTFDS